VDAERKATWTKGNTWSFAEGEASSIQMHIRGTQQAVRGAFCVGREWTSRLMTSYLVVRFVSG
jgi:hypothetical protein